MGGPDMVSLADLIDARRQRRRELRAELAPLDQDLPTEEMRTLGYIEGLRRERAGVEHHLRRAESLAPEEKVELPHVAPHEWPRASSLANDLRARLEAIDRELTRVGE
jgi:hypothetical protein